MPEPDKRVARADTSPRAVTIADRRRKASMTSRRHDDFDPALLGGVLLWRGGRRPIAATCDPRTRVLRRWCSAPMNFVEEFWPMSVCDGWRLMGQEPGR